MGSNWTFWEYQGTTPGILTGISPTEQRTYTTWNEAWFDHRLAHFPSVPVVCLLVWSWRTKWKKRGGGRLWGLAGLAIGSSATIIPSFPQVLLRDLCQAMRIVALVWFLKFFPPNYYYFIGQTVKIHLFFFSELLSSFLIGIRQSHFP